MKSKFNPMRLQFGLSTVLILTAAVAIYLALNPVEREVPSDSIVNITDLARWDSISDTKKAWKVNDEGHLVTKKNNVDLLFKTELPDVVLIELGVAYETKLDFVFGLGAPTKKSAIENELPRIRYWLDRFLARSAELFVESG